jgi:hypothetical protein
MALEQYVNNPGSTLASAITSTTATTLSVTSATGYPTSGNFRILIDTELMLVTGVSGTTFTVTRGIESTTAATHLVMATVNAIITAGSLDAMRVNESSFGAFSSLPTSGKSGDRYKQTDGPYEWIYQSGAWQAFYNGFPATLPPSTGWTGENLGSLGSVSFTNGNGYLVGNSSSGSSFLSMAYMTAPTAPYTVTCRFKQELGIINSLVNSGGLGVLASLALGFRDSGGKYVGLFLDNFNAGSGFSAHITPWASVTSPGSDYEDFTALAFAYQFYEANFFYRLTNDGTNIKISISLDGQNFYVIYTAPITTYLSDADNIAWGMLGNSGGATIALYDWTFGS